MSARPHRPVEIDPVTGHETTGHDWNGIRELNTPFPRIVIWALALAFAYSLVAWVLLPSWPLGRDYTRGMLGLDQGKTAIANYRHLEKMRSGWLAPFTSADFDSLTADQPLMARAMPAAARLFADNCAVCHGLEATGGPGFPDLANKAWLWPGDPAAIAATIRHGINTTDPDTRFSQMPAFGRDQMLKRDQIDLVADYVLSLSSGKAGTGEPGAKIFAENCAACHGEAGVGGLGTGAPVLADPHWIHGGSRIDVLTSIYDGRQGVMPAWQGRLNPAEINMLAVYVSRLKDGNGLEATQ